MQANTSAEIPPASTPPPGPQRRQSPIITEPPCSSKRKDRRSPKPRRSPNPFPVQLRFRMDRKQRSLLHQVRCHLGRDSARFHPTARPQRRQSPIITEPPCSSKRKDRRSPKPRRSPNPFPVQLRFRIDRKQRAYCTRFGVTSVGIPPASIPPPGPQRRQSAIITEPPCSSKRKDRRSPKPRRSPNPFPDGSKAASLLHQIRCRLGRDSVCLHLTRLCLDGRYH